MRNCLVFKMKTAFKLVYSMDAQRKTKTIESKADNINEF